VFYFHIRNPVTKMYASLAPRRQTSYFPAHVDKQQFQKPVKSITYHPVPHALTRFQPVLNYVTRYCLVVPRVPNTIVIRSVTMKDKCHALVPSRLRSNVVVGRRSPIFLAANTELEMIFYVLGSVPRYWKLKKDICLDY